MGADVDEALKLADAAAAAAAAEDAGAAGAMFALMRHAIHGENLAAD